MLTKLIGYVSNFEIWHKTEVDLMIKNRADFFAEHGENANKRKAPRLRETKQWNDSNWYFVKSKLNNRFTKKQFVMMYFQYGSRLLNFDWYIKKFDLAISRLSSIKEHVSDDNYNDKLSLLKCVRWMFKTMADDWQLSCLGDVNSTPTSLLSTIKEDIKCLIQNLIVATHGEELVDEDQYVNEIEEAMMLWEGGPNKNHSGTSVRHAAVFDKLWMEFKKALNDIHILDHHEQKNGPLMDQSKHLLCWIKWRMYIGTKSTRPLSTVSEAVYEAFNAFARCAFGHLGSTTSIFVLERNRF